MSFRAVNGGSNPANPVVVTGSYAPNVGDIIVCNGGSGTFTITLPSNFSNGDKISVIRGTTTQGIVIAAGAGATIAGQASWNSPGDIVAVQGNARITVVAITSTLWAVIASEGFYSPASGYGVPFNDIAVHGTLYLLFNLWLAASRTVSGTGSVNTSDLVLLATGAGGYTLTAAASWGAGQAVFLKNNAAAAVTFAPNGTGTIDGAASLSIPAGTGVLLLTPAGGSNANWTRLI